MKTSNSHIDTLANATNGIVQGQMNSLTPHNSIEANYINYYKAYSHYRDSTYAVSDSIMLKTLVDGCPARDGIAVYNARTLYGKMYYVFNFIDGCDNSSTNKTQTNTNVKEHEKVEKLVVFPNPTTGDIWIKSDNKLYGQNVVLYVNDILGNLIIQESLIINDYTKLSTNLHNGTYILTLVLKENDDNKTYKAKIIVIK